MRKAKAALFHSSIHVKGAGDLQSSLPCVNKTIDDLSMLYGPEGLVVSGKFRGVPIYFAVPAANIKVVELLPDDPKDNSSKK